MPSLRTDAETLAAYAADLRALSQPLPRWIAAVGLLIFFAAFAGLAMLTLEVLS